MATTTARPGLADALARRLGLRHADDLRSAVAAALALVVTAAAVLLSVRLDTLERARLNDLVPVLDKAVAGEPLRPGILTRVTPRECRIGGMVETSSDFTLSRDYRSADRFVEVAVFKVPDHERALRAAAAGLRTCGSFVAGEGTQFTPVTYVYAGVVESEDRVLWELLGSVGGRMTGGRAMLASAGPYVVYVADTRFGAQVDRQTFLVLAGRVVDAIDAAA